MLVGQWRLPLWRLKQGGTHRWPGGCRSTQQQISAGCLLMPMFQVPRPPPPAKAPMMPTGRMPGAAPFQQNVRARNDLMPIDSMPARPPPASSTLMPSAPLPAAAHFQECPHELIIGTLRHGRTRRTATAPATKRRNFVRAHTRTTEQRQCASMHSGFIRSRAVARSPAHADITRPGLAL